MCLSRGWFLVPFSVLFPNGECGNAMRGLCHWTWAQQCVCFGFRLNMVGGRRRKRARRLCNRYTICVFMCIHYTFRAVNECLGPFFSVALFYLALRFYFYCWHAVKFYSPHTIHKFVSLFSGYIFERSYLCLCAFNEPEEEVKLSMEFCCSQNVSIVTFWICCFSEAIQGLTEFIWNRIECTRISLSFDISFVDTKNF